MLVTSSPDTASRRSTGMPPAMLAAIRRICAALSEHGSRPDSKAATAACQSMNAIGVPSPVSPVSPNSLTKTSRTTSPHG